MSENKQDKFQFKQGDILQLDDCKIGNSQYGDWQYIKIKSPDNKTNSQLFLTEINEDIHPGDYVRIDELTVYPRRAKLENTKGEMTWSTIFKVDVKVSLAEDAGGFNAESEQLPF